MSSRATKWELFANQEEGLHRILTIPLFTFKEEKNAIGDVIGKTKIQNLTPEERLVRSRYYRNRQVAPRGQGQRIQVMRESLEEMYRIRASEEEVVEEVKKMDNIPEWRQYVLEEPKYFQ